MARKKYDIHPDFKGWAKFNPPINTFALGIIQPLMSLLYSTQKGDKSCKITRLEIPFENKNIKALLYEPTGIQENSPCLIYYHGGGFVLPGVQQHFNKVKEYAIKSNCRAIYVDYPLAPKHKFPIPLNACFESYKWVLANADKLSINANKIAVGGDSAGGNLAALVCFKAYDEKITLPCGQMLIYPAIGLEYETKSMREFPDTPMCNSRDYQKYLKLYLKSEEDKNERYVSPMRAETCGIFPASYIETAQFDCLKDEAIIFAYRLKKDGVKVFFNSTKRTMHGYDMAEKSSITKNSVQKRIDFLKYVFN